MVKLFFSYSHKDEELRNELDKHLSILKRQNIISVWHDRCIVGGSDIDHTINNHLKNSNIILLLVSSDFLASDYCYDKEMIFAMDMHETRKAVVLPVILRPCDWHGATFGKLMATPKDGKPIVKFPTLDEAFLEVTNEIKRIASSISYLQVSEPKQQPLVAKTEPLVRSSNLRIKQTFTDQDKDEFIDNAFDYIAKFFEGSLNELQKRNQGVTYRFKRVDSQTFNSSIYISGVVKSECTIFYGANMYRQSKSINYAYGITSSKNSLNESLSVADDGYQLYLNKMGLSMMRSGEEKLTYEGAAESYWDMFIGRLQG